MDALAIGGLVAIAMRRRPDLIAHRAVPLVTGALAICFGLLCLTDNVDLTVPLAYTCIDLTFAGVLILLLGGRCAWLTKLCRNKALVGLGTISYGVYLLHSAFFIFANHLTMLQSVPGGDFIEMLIAIAATICVASASWRYFESPILKLKERFAPNARMDPRPVLLREAEAGS